MKLPKSVLVQPTAYTDAALFDVFHWKDGAITLFVHEDMVAKAVELLGPLYARTADFVIDDPLHAKPWFKEGPR